MAESFFDRVAKQNAHTPDVLACLANLSNDEVFTPPEVVNQMLDMLPQELFESKETTFLDPACKTGVFLREIAKRLLEAQMPLYKERMGLISDKKSLGIELSVEDEYYIEELQSVIDHIFQKQLFGIAITELTSLLSRRSLYCSKYPDGPYSISRFENSEGNIRFKRVEHTWDKDGKCVFCGASNKWDRDEEKESHAYEFIHPYNLEELTKMKFDVIISNPPYQLSTGGGSAQAIPLYNKFVEQAKKLEPRYLSMIIPSRWYAGGMSLDKFREEMLTDKRMRVLVDYANAKDCFPGTSIGGGVCYFLWDKQNEGPCEVTNVRADTRNIMVRELDEFDIFVRYNEATNIIHKVLKKKEDILSTWCSSLSPFGIPSSERGKEVAFEKSVVLHSSKGIGYIDETESFKNNQWYDCYKVLVSKTTAEHAGEPDKSGQFRVLSTLKSLKPKEVCTFSYFLIGNELKTLEESENLIKYLKTKFARFLILQAVSSINLSKDKFCFVPVQDFSKSWCDEELYKKYDLTQEEIDFIESMIRPMEW